MPVQFRDYYETLGVPKTATEEEIRSAFRKLARKYHPDVAKDKKAAEEKFKEINEAYEVLSDPEKRKKYDKLGADWNRPGGFQPPPQWQGQQQPGGGFYQWGGDGGGGVEFEFGGTGFSDFFEAFFGGGRGRSAFGGFGGRTATAERGADVEADIMVTLEEAMSGSVRSVSIRHGVPCEHCGGTGQRARHVCNVCGGTGQVSKTETYQVKIPPGVTEGQRLRVAGRGEAGSGGAGRGDLFLRVRLAKHPDFTVDDHNLVYQAELAPWEAVLGAELSIPTLNGRVNIRIPPGTQTGQKLRVRGRGLPQRGGGNGDLIVETQVEVPGKVSDEERKLWEQLAKQSHFNPRE